MSSRFQPMGQTPTFDPLILFGAQATAADLAFQLAQQAAYQSCNQLIASVSLGDQRKNEQAQLQLLAISVPLTLATLTAAGATVGGPYVRTPTGITGITDWSATLAAMKATLAQLS